MDTFGMLRWSPPRLSSASSLRFRITLLEDAARACRAELQRRPSHCQDPPPPQPAASLSSCMLLQLGHDEIGMLAHELCDPMQPVLAINLGSTAKGMQVPTQAALAQLKQQCQEFRAFAALTGVSIVGGALHRARVVRDDAQGFEGDATQLELGSGYDKPLTLAHWRALGTLVGCGALPMLKGLDIDGDDCGNEGVALLAAGLRRSGLPSLKYLRLTSLQIGDQAASTLASALTKRAVPMMERLYLYDNQIGDVGMVALAPALRQLPKLQALYLCNNLISDGGLAALIAQPMKGVFESLRSLGLSQNSITDAGCVALASVLRSGALPSFKVVNLRSDDTADYSLAHWALFEAREGLMTI